MSQDFTPLIVGFFCNWCSYTGTDSAGTARKKMPSTVKIVRTMCSGRINPYFLLLAFFRGADGIWVSGCHPGDCHYVKGNYGTRRRFAYLQKIFEALGLEADRLNLSWISASEAPKVQRITNELTRRITEMGPNPARSTMFL